MRVLIILLSLLSQPAFAQSDVYHQKGSQDVVDWSKGDYNQRIRIERQWESEQKIVDIENELIQQERSRRIDEIFDATDFDDDEDYETW